MNKFFEELKRRNVIKGTIAYIVVAWVLLQVASVVLPIANAPEWVLKTFSFFLAIGFPVWLFFSWVYEVTPEGLKKTAQVSVDDSITTKTNKRLNVLILVGLVLAILVGLVNKSPFNSTENLVAINENIENSIAVLPFDDMSSGGDSQWFCDGVTEDILTNLSKVKGLRVISRTSVMQYKGTNKTIPEIAKELGVSYVLEGSVRKHNDKVLITGQLIKANDEHLWADNYTGSMDDVFKLQGDVSKQIVQQLKITLSPEEEKQLNTYPTKNMEAYQLYLKGRSFSEKLDDKNAKIAIDLFGQAIALDPDFSDAYAEIGFAYLILGNLSNEKSIIENIEKSLELNPNSSRANSYKGVYLFYVKQDQENAKIYLDKALELNPNDAKAHDMMAIYYSDTENGDKKDNMVKSLFHINKAVALDPFSQQSNMFKANLLTENDQFQEAEDYILEKKSLFQEDQIEGMKNYIIMKKAELTGVENKDRTKTVEFLHKEVDKDPTNKRINYALAMAYDGIMNDDANYVKYSKKAYELDTTNVGYAREYITSLSENGDYKIAEELYNSDNFQNITSRFQKLFSLRYQYYNQKNYKETIDILSDTLFNNAFGIKSLAHAQLGDKEKALALIKNQNITISTKAMIFAVLKELDSMYFYLNNDGMDFNFINGRKEFDPYRNEEKFKEVLKKHYLPNSPIK
jgi:TolB-like protein